MFSYSIFFTLRSYYFFLLNSRNQVNFYAIFGSAYNIRMYKWIILSSINYIQYLVKSVQMQLSIKYITNLLKQQYKLIITQKMQKKKRVEHLSSVVDPHRVKVLILTDQKTVYQDFYFIMRFVNIVKLDLSYNKIANFNVGFTFRAFPTLRTLFLHENKFNSLKALQTVSQSQKLQYLTLFGNPLEESKTRHYFINSVPTLKLMDDKIVTMEQRNPNINSNQIEKIIRLQFPIVPMQQSQSSTTFLTTVIKQLRIIRQKYLQANPIIIIQRWYRKRLRNMNKIIKSTKYIMKNNTDESVINKLETQMQEQVNNLENKQRLITQKMQIHVSKEQKIFSVLVMNMEFLTFLKQKSKKKVFALKQFCDQQGIKYQKTNQKLVCLKIPTPDSQSQGRGHLQLLIKSCQKYLLRRKGSEQSMNIRKKYKILEIILNKRMKRQRKYSLIIESYRVNKKLSKKIQKLQEDYQNRFVVITEQSQKIYDLLRHHFFSSMSNNKIFPFCLQEIVQRSAAAVSIQRMWRGYITRKKNGNSMQKITKNNSAWLIQRFIRSIGFKRRNSIFIQLTDYIKKQTSSNQIILPMQDIFRMQKMYRQVWSGINFVLPDQKISFHIEQQRNQVYLQRSQFIKFPSSIRNYIQSIQKSVSNKQCENFLDLLFKGVKSVRYFTSNNVNIGQKNQKLSRITSANKTIASEQKTLILNKSTSALGNSGVIIIKSSQTNTQMKKPVNQTKLVEKTSNNFVILEYQNNQEALNRKFLLAIISYQIKGNNFIQSLNLNINQNSTNAIKDISQRINEQFVVYRLNQQFNPVFGSTSKFYNREQSNAIKLKLFINQEDLTIRAKCKHPYQRVNPNAELTTNQISILDSIGGHKKSINQKELRHSANITKNIIKFLPEQFHYETKSSANNFVSYRQFEEKFNKKLKSRYQDLQLIDNKNKSLEKCQSLQPNTTRKQGERNSNDFLTTDENLQKSYTTQVRLLNATENLRAKLNTYDKNMHSSIVSEQKQTKKKVITIMKQSHKERIESNHKYKKEQLNKLREKLNDEMEQNNRIIQSNRLDGILANARKHNRVIRALNRKAVDGKNFQRDFLKRGNSSIRKDMIKFQQDRSSSKSPDNESISIYQSKKSIQQEQTKYKIVKRAQKILNLKTEIKQFSIDDGSDLDGDLSLGAFQSQNRSKQKHRKSCQKQKKQQQQQRNKERQKRQMSGKVEMDIRKKQLKKKKVVHSVFPEQFYPLKQTKRIGFQLPKINKK